VIFVISAFHINKYTHIFLATPRIVTQLTKVKHSTGYEKARTLRLVLSYLSSIAVWAQKKVKTGSLKKAL
jgi:hypothetical protein